mmetsp:Transcript_515/g.865  ORF Transcript_515/g.865 Transcript_515/m.865 type:complete len:234 (-) Transcript_515:997-1698(-)
MPGNPEISTAFLLMSNLSSLPDGPPRSGFTGFPHPSNQRSNFLTAPGFPTKSAKIFGRCLSTHMSLDPVVFADVPAEELAAAAADVDVVDERGAFLIAGTDSCFKVPPGSCFTAVVDDKSFFTAAGDSVFTPVPVVDDSCFTATGDSSAGGCDGDALAEGDLGIGSEGLEALPDDEGEEEAAGEGLLPLLLRIISNSPSSSMVPLYAIFFLLSISSWIFLALDSPASTTPLTK